MKNQVLMHKLSEGLAKKLMKVVTLNGRFFNVDKIGFYEMNLPYKTFIPREEKSMLITNKLILLC